MTMKRASLFPMKCKIKSEVDLLSKDSGKRVLTKKEKVSLFPKLGKNRNK